MTLVYSHDSLASRDSMAIGHTSRRSLKQDAQLQVILVHSSIAFRFECAIPSRCTWTYHTLQLAMCTVSETLLSRILHSFVPVSCCILAHKSCCSNDRFGHKTFDSYQLCTIMHSSLHNYWYCAALLQTKCLSWLTMCQVSSQQPVKQQACWISFSSTSQDDTYCAFCPPTDCNTAVKVDGADGGTA